MNRYSSHRPLGWSSRPLVGRTAGCGLAAAMLLASVATLAAEPAKYQSAQEAFGVGAAFYNSRNLAAAIEPLEAAFALSKDEKMKVQASRALMDCYRTLNDADKMFTAVEYVVTKSGQPAERSIVRTSLMSFIHQRGKADEAVTRYEAQLAADPRNRTALYLLAEIYARLKEDPAKGVEILERLVELDKQEGKPVDVRQQAELAEQYVKLKKFKEGAELFESVTTLDPKMAAWHWKEAATAWISAGDKPRALEAAKKSDASTPENRGELLVHFWHRALGDVYLEAGEPKLAIPHYEAAIANTSIEGYAKDCRAKLAEATRQAEGK